MEEPLCCQSTASSCPPLKFSISSILAEKSNCFPSPSALSPSSNSSSSPQDNPPQSLYPAWIFCTRYSDRPSSGGRNRRLKKKKHEKEAVPSEDDKRPRTAFTPHQLSVLRQQFLDNRYLTEKRRQQLAHQLGLNEAQIKIWFQNKRAKLKKASQERPPLQILADMYKQSTSALS